MQNFFSWTRLEGDGLVKHRLRVAADLGGNGEIHNPVLNLNNNATEDVTIHLGLDHGGLSSLDETRLLHGVLKVLQVVWRQRLCKEKNKTR